MTSLSSTPPLDLIERYNQAFAMFWHPVLRSVDLRENTLQRVSLLDHDIAVARLNGGLVALSNSCRHFQALLSDGEIDTLENGTEVVRCSYHGWAYGHTGRCLHIPQLKSGRIPANAKVATYHIAEQHDVIWICLADEPRFDIPAFPELTAEDMYAIPVQYSHPWECSVIRMILSALDDYHFPWLHQGILGDRSRPDAPEREIVQTDRQLITTFQQTQPANVTNNAERDYVKTEAVVHYTMIVDMPNVLRLTKRNEQGGAYTVWFAPMAQHYNSTPIFWRVVRNYDLGEDRDQAVIEMEQLIQSQDRRHVGKQRPWTSQPLPIKGVDDALHAYLRWLTALGIPANV